jgi:hypothetical protein
MAPCSRWRDAPAPAGASRLAESSSPAPERVAATAWPPCLLWIASMSWPLRIRPTPVMPMDWANRCNSGSNMSESPRPGARAAWPAPVPPATATPGPAAGSRVAPEGGDAGPENGSGESGRLDESPGRSGVPVKNSVVSLTKGPSKNSGAGLRSRTRCAGPVNQPGHVVHQLRAGAVSRSWPREPRVCARGREHGLAGKAQPARRSPRSCRISSCHAPNPRRRRGRGGPKN